MHHYFGTLMPFRIASVHSITLILGSALKSFLQEKRQKNKQKCQPFEIYCVRCRAPQFPAGNMADYEALNSCSGRLIGICPVCDGIINKYINLTKLNEIQDKLSITKTRTLGHISESIKSLLNCDFKR
jgi:hypothetical protein